jgi:PRTRC genetic system protein F
LIEPARSRRDAAELAELLIEAGMINRRRFRTGCTAILAVCQSALDAWISMTVGDVRCFTPYFEMRQLQDFDATCATSARRKRTAARPTAPAVEISWKEASVCHWGVGAGLDFAEACVPLLGATVLDIMERKGAHAYPLFTPSLALDEASYLYWRGEDDESLALDEDCGEDLAARAAMAADMVTRATVEAAFPAWALDYNRPRLPAEALASIAANHACGYVRRMAQLAYTLDGLRTTSQYCEEQDGPFVGFGAVLCWRDGDLAVQISDDYANLAWQGEYCDEIGQVTFTLDDPGAMGRWMRQVRPNLAAIGLLDALLMHLSERE